MKLSQALTELESGKTIKRPSWLGGFKIERNMFIYEHVGFAIASVNLKVEDVSADDWIIVE